MSREISNCQLDLVAYDEKANTDIAEKTIRSDLHPSRSGLLSFLAITERFYRLVRH